MDVLVLIDKLDDTVHNAKQVPLTDTVRVDKEEIYDILDQMRATIPEEIKQARWIVKERQEMLAEAKREAERVIKEAREEQTRLIGEEEVVKQAERQAEEIIEDARAREREIRLGAEDYADDILNTLEVNLTKFIAAVQRGRDRLRAARKPRSRRAEAAGSAGCARWLLRKQPARPAAHRWSSSRLAGCGPAPARVSAGVTARVTGDPAVNRGGRGAASTDRARHREPSWRRASARTPMLPAVGTHRQPPCKPCIESVLLAIWELSFWFPGENIRGCCFTRPVRGASRVGSAGSLFAAYATREGRIYAPFRAECRWHEAGASLALRPCHRTLALLGERR